MYIIKGFKKNSGEFNGKHWENYTLFCTNPDDPAVVGESVATFKVRNAVLSNCFPSPDCMIGESVVFAMETRNFGGKPSVVVTNIEILDRKEKA